MNKAYRIIAAFVMVASLLWGWWWLTCILAVAFLFIFPSYYELLLWGVVYDALYGVALPQFYYFPYVFTAGSIVLFLLSLLLRKLLLAYEPTI